MGLVAIRGSIAIILSLPRVARSGSDPTYHEAGCPSVLGVKRPPQCSAGTLAASAARLRDPGVPRNGRGTPMREELFAALQSDSPLTGNYI